MQRDTAASATPPVIDAVLDLIRTLRLAYAPVMVGPESSDRIYHVLDVLAGQVSALHGGTGRTPPVHLTLLPAHGADSAPTPQAGVAADRLPTHTVEAPPITSDLGHPQHAAKTQADDPMEPPSADDSGPGSSDDDGAREPVDTPAAREPAPAAPSPPEPPVLGNEPREDVGHAFRSAFLADLARRSSRSASTPPAPRTDPTETATCPAPDASASTTPVRTAMPAS
jgi:hypothetical protein